MLSFCFGLRFVDDIDVLMFSNNFLKNLYLNTINPFKHYLKRIDEGFKKKYDRANSLSCL